MRESDFTLLTRKIAPPKSSEGLNKLKINSVSDSAGDFAGAQAASASVNVLGRTVDDGLDALHIGLPCTIGASVGVADFDAECHILITKLTLCHSLKHLLACV